MQGEKVLLIVNEANEKVYLSGRNVPTLAINTANAVQVCRRGCFCAEGRQPTLYAAWELVGSRVMSEPCQW